MNNFNLKNGDKTGALKLSSIKTPRDLTLGGCGPLLKAKANKKVYTPNVNVTRKKTIDVKTAKDTTRKVKNKIEKNKFDRNNRNSNNFVQTLGVFSDGVGASLKKSHSSSEPNIKKSDETRPRRQISQQNGRIDKKAEQKRLNDLLGDSDSNEECEFVNLENHPVKLLNDDVKKLGTPKTNQVGDESKIDDINKLLDAPTPKLFLLQLPDTLPCEKSEVNQSDTNAEKTINEKSSMSMLQEGQIGKIIRYKSGKQKLMIGNTAFDLSLGMESTFLQQLVSLQIRNEERSGDMINMGKVSLKLTTTPDWDSLLPS